MGDMQNGLSGVKRPRFSGLSFRDDAHTSFTLLTDPRDRHNALLHCSPAVPRPFLSSSPPPLRPSSPPTPRPRPRPPSSRFYGGRAGRREDGSGGCPWRAQGRRVRPRAWRRPSQTAQAQGIGVFPPWPPCTSSKSSSSSSSRVVFYWEASGAGGCSTGKGVEQGVVVRLGGSALNACLHTAPSL